MISTRGLLAFARPAIGLIGALLLTTLAGCCDPCANADRKGMPVHLEELADAAIEGAEVPADRTQPLEWTFDAGAAGWAALPSFVAGATPANAGPADDGGAGLRVELPETARAPEDDGTVLYGGIFLDMPEGFDLAEWTHVEVEATCSGPVIWMGNGFNVREAAGETPGEQWATTSYGGGTPLRADGTQHSYRWPIAGSGSGAPDEQVRQLSIEMGAAAPGRCDFEAVRFIPADETYATAGHGVRSVISRRHDQFGPQRRTLFTHAPARVSYEVDVPAAGRLDLGFGSFGGATRMAVEVTARGESKTLVDEEVPPGEPWRQHSVDLAEWAGRGVTLSLVAEPAQDGDRTVALWTAPTLSSDRSSDPGASHDPDAPNVVFYVIDGASAGLMSVYGYNRRTTPNLERIAQEGVVFERAHSNATWTMPSTASFMTSLHHSVLGGLRDDANPVPANATTMAEHFHGAGYHTGVFTMNPNAGALSGLDRGVDIFRDYGTRGGPPGPLESISSQILHREFWQWRDAYPGPFWAHFQTTDVHPPYFPPPPFKGLFVDPARGDEFTTQLQSIPFPFSHDSASVHEHYQEELAKAEIDPAGFYDTMRALHDETMAHQDHQIGVFVERLKKTGAWGNTLLIIASDHGHPAASYPRFGRGLMSPQPAAWEGALFGDHETHVPLIFVWPGKIEGGRRIADPVSMIDVLPTVLDLVGLPQPEIAQGQSLAPLLRGESGWEPRPVVFDEFRRGEDGALIGNLEIVDGRWGQSLEIRAAEGDDPAAVGRHPAPAGGRWKAQSFDEVPRLLLYDLWDDRTATRHVNDAHPDRVEEADERLRALWTEHRALATRFQEGDEAELSPEQLEALRALGYIE